MPLRNRVTPLGDVIADPARGLVYGNRGCLHDAEGRIRRVFGVRRWISCRLAYRGWRRSPLLQPGRFTELFFLDEATAFAAGHRPCALCRHEDYATFTDRWRRLHRADVGADALDARLHAERFDPAIRAQRRHEARGRDLPDGVMLLLEGVPWLVLGSALRRWTPAGYADGRARPSGRVTVLTPPSVVEVLREPWEGVVPFLHPSARG